MVKTKRANNGILKLIKWCQGQSTRNQISDSLMLISGQLNIIYMKHACATQFTWGAYQGKCLVGGNSVPQKELRSVMFKHTTKKTHGVQKGLSMTDPDTACWVSRLSPNNILFGVRSDRSLRTSLPTNNTCVLSTMQQIKNHYQS